MITRCPFKQPNLNFVKCFERSRSVHGQDIRQARSCTRVNERRSAFPPELVVKIELFWAEWMLSQL
jgi:hypothetical protein